MTTRKDFETKFAETGRNIDEIVSDTRESMREERQNLRRKWDDLETKRAEVADKGDDVWDTIKSEMEEGWKDVQDSYDDIKENFSHDQDHTEYNH